jgi:hypothetical protein
MSAVSAQAAVVDFNELTHGGGAVAVQPLTSGGFTFSTTPAPGPGTLIVWGSANPFNLDPGGAAVSVNRRSAIVNVSRVGGGIFDLVSIDLADVFNGPVGGDIQFDFTDAGGTSSQLFSLDTFAGGQTAVFNRAGLTSFTMQGLTTRNQQLQFDNLVYNLSVTGGVPEPATWAMMIAGFGFVGGAMRKANQGRKALAT